MAFEVGELDAGHLFLAVNPLVAVIVIHRALDFSLLNLDSLFRT
jgi:hypothetical protein